MLENYFFNKDTYIFRILYLLYSLVFYITVQTIKYIIDTVHIYIKKMIKRMHYGYNIKCKFSFVYTSIYVYSKKSPKTFIPQLNFIIHNCNFYIYVCYMKYLLGMPKKPDFFFS